MRVIMATLESYSSVANPVLSFLFKMLRERESSSFLSQSPHLPVWVVTIQSVQCLPPWIMDEPATSECGGDLRWLSSPLLYNSSCSCHRLSVDLKKVEGKRNHGNLQSIKAARPVSAVSASILLVVDQWLTVLCRNPLAVFILALSAFWWTISKHQSTSAGDVPMVAPGSVHESPWFVERRFYL